MLFSQFIFMFGAAEREVHPKRVLNKQEWWFTLEPNPVPEEKWWDAKIEGEWWICRSDGKGNFHIVKSCRSKGRGIDEEGLFEWLSGFGIDRSCVVKWGTKFGRNFILKERE